jgi:hypothetical protein
MLSLKCNINYNNEHIISRKQDLVLSNDRFSRSNYSVLTFDSNSFDRKKKTLHSNRTRQLNSNIIMRIRVQRMRLFS